MSDQLNRRTFVKAVAAAGITAAMASSGEASPATSGAGERKRYALVGTGSRSAMYRDAIEVKYKEHAELVGLCDSNPGRLALALKQSQSRGSSPKTYAPDQFEKMIEETKPQTIIVTSMCSTHVQYIVRAMKAGCDVITEKPMATTAPAVQQIFDARKSTGKRCRVTFNYRYSPPRTQVKDILMSGVIGDVLSLDFHWLLNTHHGADYFRRWHRNKKNSGGLLVHKATHHFDLINWWLGALPTSVYATGKREFYTPTMAKRFGLTGAHERCLTCPEKDKCSFYLDLAADKSLKALYLDNEKYDGYFRDRCVWSDEIDIEDTMNVLVRYDNHVTLAYSLNAFNAWEGYIATINGTKGRLEHTTVENTYAGKSTTATSAPVKPSGVKNVIVPIRGAAYEVETWTGEGSHGGGDAVLLDDLFLPNPKPDKYLRASDERGGAASCLIGIAGNESIRTGQPIEIDKIVTGLTAPEYAPMPSRTGPVPMPPRRSPG
jgi:predicted dehydrogenase